MTRMTEEQKGRWVAALARRIRRRVVAMLRPGAVREQPAPAAGEPPAREGR